ncbi:hypothetical protein CQW23_16526 [Capsicum baccatum]|uniref:Uncharacterized protein n=1 Tax=Capsicum baccatum TaxID=33114 RepID=A0A2G2WB72_CAPBA|nr:hypothetical protein CQW23_16526 [Capsicum baccatum]
MSPYQLIYGKACHLPIELDHKALWALKRLNVNWDDAMNLRVEQLNKMNEFRLHAYERSDLYKERMKKYHDQWIVQRNFQKDDMVLLFNSRLKLFLGTMAPKARQGKDKATTSQKGKKRGRKEQGESSSMQLPRRMFGIKWVLEEEAKEWYRNNKERKYVHVDLINKESLAK